MIFFTEHMQTLIALKVTYEFPFVSAKDPRPSAPI